VEDSNSCGRILIFGFYSFIVFLCLFFLFPFIRHLLPFYILVFLLPFPPFTIGFFIVLPFFPIFSCVFVSVFRLIWFSSLAYPTCLVLKGLIVVVVGEQFMFQMILIYLFLNKVVCNSSLNHLRLRLRNASTTSRLE
jgi:hypothetical protein